MTLKEFARAIYELVANDSNYNDVQVELGLLFCNPGRGDSTGFALPGIVDDQGTYTADEVGQLLDNYDFGDTYKVDDNTKAALVIKRLLPPKSK